MQREQRVKIAIQKQGRLSNDSLALLSACGLELNDESAALVRPCKNFPVDILFIRDDDIPTFVQDGICQLGIVGENVLIENAASQQFTVLKRLGFGRCRLSIAVPEDFQFNDLSDLNNIRIATSYPKILKSFCEKNNLNVEIVYVSGSVEIAPSLGMSEAIVDLVASGNTLKQNGLREVACILNSEALLVTKKQGEFQNEYN
jgi:ATP phosphoribosyltransferase